MNTFVFLKYLTQLAMPPASLAIGPVVGLALLWRGWRRLGRTVIVLAIAETVALSWPPVADALIGTLEGTARAAASAAQPCCYNAIVVLGGGISPAVPPARADPDLLEAADRMWEAARLYRRGVAPRIIVSGGGVMAQGGHPETTEAEAMRRFLVALGVPDGAIVSESTSLNTIDNIGYPDRLPGSEIDATVLGELDTLGRGARNLVRSIARNRWPGLWPPPIGTRAMTSRDSMAAV